MIYWKEYGKLLSDEYDNDILLSDIISDVFIFDEKIDFLICMFDRRFSDGHFPTNEEIQDFDIVYYSSCKKENYGNVYLYKIPEFDDLKDIEFISFYFQGRHCVYIPNKLDRVVFKLKYSDNFIDSNVEYANYIEYSQGRRLS